MPRRYRSRSRSRSASRRRSVRRRSRSRSGSRKACKAYQYRSPATGHCRNYNQREAAIAKMIIAGRRRRSRSRSRSARRYF